MYKKQIKLAILTALMLTILISTNAFASSTYTRLSGSDRYETSSKIALNGWTQSDYAILALGEDYPDALCASPLAGKYKAPILLTEKDSLPSSTLSTIQQLKVKNIFIIGGTGVISSAVENQLTSMGIAITRLAGQDRYETDIAVAKQLDNVSQIAVVTGEDYADALSIAPIAVKLNMPIILVSKDNIPQEVKDYISSQSITKTYVIGKGTSIDNEDGLPNITEINGQDKYSRNIAIINAFKGSFDFSTIYLATGNNFADALSGSILAGMNGNPLILVGSDTTNEKSLLQLVAPNANIKILGGIGAVADNTATDIAAATTTTPVNTPDVYQIKFLSPNLIKTGSNTATFQYKILDKAGTDITKIIPASQLLVSSSVSSTITLDPSTGIGTVTYNSASDVDKTNIITIIDSVRGIAVVNIPPTGDSVPVTLPTSAVSQINFLSPDLTKTSGTTATFQYRILDKAGTDITKTIPASQLLTSVSVSATITLNPSTGIGMVTYNSASDVDKSNTVTIVDNISGIVGTNTPATKNPTSNTTGSETSGGITTSKISKITINSTKLSVAPDVVNPPAYGTGYATYIVQDQNGNDISNSSLSNNLTFTCSVGTVRAFHGLLSVTPNAGVNLRTLTSVVITGSDSITGVSTSATLIIAP